MAPETTQAPAEVAPETTPERKPAAAPRAVRTTRRVTTVRRAPARVVVVGRSFLDAGTDVAHGERKYLDYALPPTHQPIDLVTNTGGRVGWHNSPLPGPFFPFFY